MVWIRFRARLDCPGCGYDLRGLELWHDHLRCPECGRGTTIDALAADLVNARRRRRQSFHALMATLMLASVVMLMMRML